MKEELSTRAKGSKAEDLACEFLISKDYKIVKRNFHYGRIGEIDIVAEKKGILVFVEVKSLTEKSYGSPLDSITPKKQSSIRKVAEGYYYINKLEDKESRYDVITIDFRTTPTKIEHYEYAFY